MQTQKSMREQKAKAEVKVEEGIVEVSKLLET